MAKMKIKPERGSRGTKACRRMFRLQHCRYEEEDLEGLNDNYLPRASLPESIGGEQSDG